jgi:DAK2 domain fusion protein YloV
MQTLERLYATHLKAAVVCYRDLLRSHQEFLNRLNVYPVPDGDTGTNMALTLESVVEEVGAVHDMAEVCKAMSHGSLMGARGNSGVILSQVLRGLADAWKPLEHIGPDDVVVGFEAAATAAYAAVMRPVEGTILTVVRATADAASASTAAHLADVLDEARRAAGGALEETPELLPVLKEAGVVDAGAAGFVLLLDALLHHIARRPLPEPPQLWSGLGTVSGPQPLQSSAAGDLRYEVMFLLDADDAAVPSFKGSWAAIGESIVVVGGDGVWNCHIHTDDVGAAIEAAVVTGRPRQIRVTDLAEQAEQVQEERWVADAVVGGADAVPCACAVVAVGTGSGIGRIFRSLGVHRLVAGGQSMNPSTGQILEAVEAVAASSVVVLPNNKNIVAVAEQVDRLTTKTVRVVPTTNVAQGFAALLDYDAAADVDVNARSMAAAAARVVSGDITRAVRASTSAVGPIAEGDYLGIGAGGIVAVAADLAGAATALLDSLVGDGHELVTIISGDGSSPEVTHHLTAWLAEHRPRVETETHHGAQPLYPYFFSVE